MLGCLPPMFPSSRPRVVKHCPEGHEMQMSWRDCPKCTGRRPAPAAAGRDMSEMTMILTPDEVAEVAPPPPPRPTWVALFVAAGGPESGRRIEVTPGRWKLGKAPREEDGFQRITVADPFMSREHFALEAGVAAVVLRDLGSTNGTFVNGARVDRHVLCEGDQVRAGESTYRVSVPPGAPGS